jgi:hypothetical protein
MNLSAQIEVARIRVENANRVHNASLNQRQTAMSSVMGIAEKMLEMGVVPENAIAEIALLEVKTAMLNNL